MGDDEIRDLKQQIQALQEELGFVSFFSINSLAQSLRSNLRKSF
jgi:hypothetical protein